MPHIYAAVFDTNVLLAASGFSPQASPKCVERCVGEIEAVKDRGVFVIDGVNVIYGDIYREYKSQYRKYKSSNISGSNLALLSKFYRYLHNNQGNPDKIETVPLTPLKGGGWRQYEEFPDDSALQTFDANDQKFIAVARASRLKPQPCVLNARDRGYKKFEPALKAHVVVKELCPDDLRPAKARNRRRKP